MRLRILAAGCVMLSTALAAQPPQPTAKDVQEAITANPYQPYHDADVATLRTAVIAELRRRPIEAAADAVAPQFGLERADMRRLLRGWVLAQSRQYEPDHAWVAPTRADLLALAPRFRGNRVALAFLADALDSTQECVAGDFDALIQGSADFAADGYLIAVAATCDGNFARAAAVAGDRATPALIRLADYGGLPPRDQLPLYAWLTSDAALSHVRAEDRPAVAALLWQRSLKALFAAGFEGRALAAYDALPAGLRAAIVSPGPRPAMTAVVDGITMTFEGEEKGKTVLVEDNKAQADAMADAMDEMADEMEGNRPKTRSKPLPRPAPKPPVEKFIPRNLASIDAPILQLAEAMAVAGREDEARRLLATLPGLAEAKAAMACFYGSTDKRATTCPDAQRLPMRALTLDHLLNAPHEDPYPIAETTLSDSMRSSGSASNAVLCRVFPKDDYPDLCSAESGGADLDWTSTDAAELAGAEAAIERVVPDFKALRTAILGNRDRSKDAAKPSYHRDSVAAVPPDFGEKPIPPEFAGQATPASVRGLAPLPEGFTLVRAERSGTRAVAISLSQTYDPSGEVSQGGYWVHVSDDGGRHWDAPLYTGLADRFPYVVAPASRLPLIDGDTIRVAVDIAEIDTASITYPPVGLRARRTAKGLYLTIPLATLSRDSDGDGITDLAAHHLLLDRPGSSGGTPFIVGSDVTADCRTAPSPGTLALIALLGRVTGGSERALVEAVDRPAGEIGTGWRRATATTDQPIFLIGNPADYRCLASRRLVIVYDKDDLAGMAAFTPDFHALELPKIVFNRARDRGYVRWSAGWTGGTYRLRLVDGAWQFDVTSSWIT